VIECNVQSGQQNVLYFVELENASTSVILWHWMALASHIFLNILTVAKSKCAEDSDVCVSSGFRNYEKRSSIGNMYVGHDS